VTESTSCTYKIDRQLCIGAISWLTYPRNQPQIHTHTYIHSHINAYTYTNQHTHCIIHTTHQIHTHHNTHTNQNVFFIFYFLLLLFSISTGGIIPSFQSICLVTTSPIVTASIRKDIITHNYDSRNGYLYSCWMNACLGRQPEMSISPEHWGLGDLFLEN